RYRFGADLWSLDGALMLETRPKRCGQGAHRGEISHQRVIYPAGNLPSSKGRVSPLHQEVAKLGEGETKKISEIRHASQIRLERRCSLSGRKCHVVECLFVKDLRSFTHLL